MKRPSRRPNGPVPHMTGRAGLLMAFAVVLASLTAACFPARGPEAPPIDMIRPLPSGFSEMRNARESEGCSNETDVPLCGSYVIVRGPGSTYEETSRAISDALSKRVNDAKEWRSTSGDRIWNGVAGGCPSPVLVEVLPPADDISHGPAAKEPIALVRLSYSERCQTG